MKYRIISMVLALVLAVGMIILPVGATGTEGDWKYEKIEGGLRLTAYLGTQTELTLPDVLAGENVIEIGAGCFREANLTEVTIPHGIRVVGEEAFYGCAALKKAHLGGSVNIIGDRAFAYTGLIKMDIPGCVRSIGAEAFLGCEKLYNIVIEEGVEEWTLDYDIGFDAGSVKMEEGIQSIGDRAFYDCSNLTKMFIPASVVSIGNQAMGYTGAGKQSYQMFGYTGTAAETYASENGMTFHVMEAHSGNYGKCGAEVNWLFDPQRSMLTITGDGRMYDYAAAECLPWYDFRDDITTAEVGERVTSMGAYALSGTAVEQVSLPESLELVEDGAFADCENLEELTFSANAPVFRATAFENTTLVAWYPGENETWTEAVRQNYGGTIIWRVIGGLPFVDVPEGSFYYDAVAWALEQKITTGTDATHFSPNAQCQRAAVVTFLWRAAGSPKPESDSNPFKDVKRTDFYYEAVLWAVGEGITNGLAADQFGPFAYCNRAQVVTFLYRTMGNPEVTGAENPFVDVPGDQWYASAVLWAVKNGITNGLDAAHFGPDEICNRAQIVTFLYRTMVK